jgi:murein L,D-transpeptidase YcbB/YkuD
MPTASLPTLSPATVQHTEQAIQVFEGVLSRGGWPEVTRADRMRLGSRHPGVGLLRRRLTLSGDLDARAGVSDVYDSYVDAAVRRFQARHGLSVDGIVREQTLKALNVPAAVRLAQLRTNLVRLRSMSGNLGSRFVVCNIPAAQIEAIEGGVAISRHTAVVGKPDRPSPDINSKIVEINFNPFWTVPASIVRKDLIPKMQAEPDYLTNNRIRIFDPRGNEQTPAQINWYSEEATNYMFKQDPGDLNSLGSIRINFPSKHGVYMHDTPSKNLFGEDFRFHSSGCVRVQNVRELVNWLLVETPGWGRKDIDQAIKSGDRLDAKIARPVPLYWVYVTAWATPDGVTQFRDDIYNRDGLGPMATTTRG